MTLPVSRRQALRAEADGLSTFDFIDFMEFFIITLALFGGFFRGTLNKVSNLELSAPNNIEASLLSGVRKQENNSPVGDRTKKIEDSKIDASNDLKSKIENLKLFSTPPIKITEAQDPEISARAAILMDMKTDKIMFAKNSNEKLPIASISKIFTALAVYDKIPTDKIITITQDAVDTEGLAGDLKPGEEFRAGDLIDLMLICSSNDAAAQFSKEAAGGKKDFAALMNKKANELGLKNTSFVEPSGLSEQNISTAFEIAQTADATFGRVPIWNILKQKEADIYSLDGNKHHLKNTNDIISEKYIIAGKTGYTSKAGGTLAVIADSGHNNRKIISVVLGSEDRFGDTKKLIKWGRKNFKW